MEYAQLNESKTEAIQVTAHGNVEWDATHFCPASALTDEEAMLFRVVALVVTEQPAIDQMRQAVIRDGCEFVDGKWRYKWRVDALSAEQIAANQAAAAQSLQDAIVNATQARLDNFALTRNYDGILSAASYATDPSPRFASDGQCAVNARSATWAALYRVLAEVEAGIRPMPASFADVEPALPVLEWPV